MQLEKIALSKKYAAAFLNLFMNQLNDEDIKKFETAETFLKKNRRNIFFLRFPSIDASLKQKVLNLIFEKFQINPILFKLTDLLKSKKRLFLLRETIKQICIIYKRRKNIIDFNISSSHQLNEHQKKVIQEFLEHNTKKNITSSYKINPNLIAGIRLQSNELLWEYSIQKKLRLLNKELTN
ncbi:MAG: ATP synthase subunit delta [candidate division TM6 bacterium GW2011_GWF2_32_72]|nr:MAG: ATP synthase subunit delta [candidate division TM6 bacterium GW2011_GWF2_32_72]